LKVADVRAGRTGVDEIAQRVEKRVGIVVGQEAARRKAGGRGPVDRGRIGDRAGRVGRTVDAVGAGTGDDRGSAGGGQELGGRQRKFLIAAPFALSGDANRRFAAGDDAGRTACRALRRRLPAVRHRACR